MPSQILAVSGVLGDGPRSRGLITYAASLAGSPGGSDGRTRLCFVPTAEGDSPLVLDWFTDAFGNDPGIEPSVLTFFPQPGVPDVRRHLLAQDVLWVGGGSVVNLMAVWRAHGLPILPRGYATEGGVGVHYVDGTFHEAVTVSPGRHAWWVEGDTERPITPRVLP